jgi:hypothetical protein
MHCLLMLQPCNSAVVEAAVLVQLYLTCRPSLTFHAMLGQGTALAVLDAYLVHFECQMHVPSAHDLAKVPQLTSGVWLASCERHCFELGALISSVESTALSILACGAVCFTIFSSNSSCTCASSHQRY